MSQTEHLKAEILDLLGRVGRDQTILSPAQFADSKRSAKPRSLDFGVMFFSASADEAPAAGLYHLVKHAGCLADRLGFSAIWLPERHFHSFGGPYPAPEVLGALLADNTENIRLRTGSITLPLNHPIRVVEAWSMIDHLSKGRVELGFGSGWSPNDFVLAPDCFAERKQLMQSRIEQVRALWRGDALAFLNGEAESVKVRTFPAPLQSEPPIWISATGNPETFRWAGAHGFNVLTMLLGTTLQDIAERVGIYRQARLSAGLDPDAGKVALMLHTLVHPDEARVMEAIKQPFTRYVRDALDAQRHASAEGRALDEEQREKMVNYATERYTRTAALFGDALNCKALLNDVAQAGVDEIACLIDFGPEESLVLEGLHHLAQLRDDWNGSLTPALSRRERGIRPVCPASFKVNTGKIAVIGMSCVLPGSPDVESLLDALRDNVSALKEPPPNRSSAALSRGGFIDDAALFDPVPFHIAPIEASSMDPHHRLLLTLARRCFLDAGLNAQALKGASVGVFTALYSDSFAELSSIDANHPDPLAVTGRIHAMAPNRISYSFDLNGPSELVATACSSGLVAVHRAIQALRQGECKAALVCASSLLLSDAESKALRALGVLSPEDRCKPFDFEADGQARGEGACAFLLKPLEGALAEGDPIHALIWGSAVNHAGGASGSLLLPNSNRQAECIESALKNAGLALSSIDYIEAHGAGGVGDHAELAALAELWRSLGEQTIETGIAMGSGKAAIGSLDAAGGLAGMARAILALREDFLPGLAAGGRLQADHPLQNTPFYLNLKPKPWTMRHAGVHAYGLGGVNAHLILGKAPCEPKHSSAQSELIFLSARNQAALQKTAARLCAFLKRKHAADLGDVAHTLRIGRDVEACRWWTVVDSMSELIEKLQALALGQDVTEKVAERTPEIPLSLRERVGVRGPSGACAMTVRIHESLDFKEVLDALALADSAAEIASLLRAIKPAIGCKRLSMPLPEENPMRFPLNPHEADIVKNPVGDFYDYVTRESHESFSETYLTLAPFAKPVAGFSWTQTLQNPEAYPEHHRLVFESQKEMRAVAFAEVDFSKVQSVMDFGCGLCTDLIVLAKAFPHLQGVGYTISANQAQAGLRRIQSQGLEGRISVHHHDSARDAFPGRFDLIFGFEVAHHIEDKDGLFANIAGSLNLEGHLVLADTVAGTLAPVELKDIGSFTLPRDDYARLFARHGLEIISCIDLSHEISNFLIDPQIDSMLEAEAIKAQQLGRSAEFPLASAVQRSWHAFGSALSEGLMLYVLIHARKALPGVDPLHSNLIKMEAS